MDSMSLLVLNGTRYLIQQRIWSVNSVVLGLLDLLIIKMITHCESN